MVDSDDFTRTGLVLQQVTEIDDKEIGRGSYGRVYSVSYLGKTCVAKQIQSKIYSNLVDKVGQANVQELFLKWCILCSKLRHPNVIQFLGVYYYPVGPVGVPAMVMEMLSCNLSSLVNNHQNILVHVKYSIVHDISLGLRYLHNCNPPIVHRNLFPNNILITDCYVAKISDIVLANGILDQHLPHSSAGLYTTDFLSPEELHGDAISTPADVFSFAGISLYVFNQRWPRVSIQKKLNHHTVTLSEVEKRQEHLDKMRTEFATMRPLLVDCLNDDPAARPSMEIVSDIFQRDKKKYVKEGSHNDATFNKPLKQSNVVRFPQNRIKQDAPPLIPALISGRYTMKWTRLADLPVPMNFADVAAKDDQIFATAASSFDNSFHHLYVYNVNKDDWCMLPPSGHWDGVPHIIGGKLAIIGGYLASTNEVTNKVSTFNEDSLSWISYYPDMMLARRQPGVVSYLEHVFVLGGKMDETYKTRDDIEILDWRENIQWKKVALKLPMPMWGFTPSTCDAQLIIVGYHDEVHRYNVHWMIPFTDILTSVNEPTDTSKWSELAPSDPYWSIALLPNSSPPVIVGGRNGSGTASTDCIKVYDKSDESWKTIATLSSARGRVAVATINDTAVIVIGGVAQMNEQGTSKSYNLTTVELGQVELTQLRKPSIIKF